jgi:hypothetical protein
MRGRLDGKIYQEALQELRRRHIDEFAEIRRALLQRSRVEVQTPDPAGGRTKCLQFLAEYIDSVGTGPSSFHEIGKAIGVSWNAARLYCNALEAGGLITRDHDAYRSAETIRPTTKALILTGRRIA